MNSVHISAAPAGRQARVGKVEWINGFATPPSLPLRPIHAAVSVWRLLRNKEDTRQFFEIVTSLTGSSGKKLFRRFIETAYGRKVVTEPVRLDEILGDRTALAALPEGSLGRAYLAFMNEENLAPDGLRDAAIDGGFGFEHDPAFEEFDRVFSHIEVIHDLWHVLLGYGRDALGELGVLTFTYQQTKNRGVQFFDWVVLFALKFEAPRQPIWTAFREAVRTGRDAVWVLEYDVVALLKLPLDEARSKLGISAPKIYNSVPDSIKNNFLKPVIAQPQSEQENHKKSLAA